MAFQGGNSGQERANRKILEQLEEQKRRLKGQVVTSTAPPTASTSVPGHLSTLPTTQHVTSLAEPQHMTPAQRTALQHAQANSVGYFITQDSSFGNLILPVLPRFDKV